MEELVEYISDFFQNFTRIILSISFFDVLDIIILTFLVYYVIKLIRETRAVPLLKGIFFIVIIFVLVQIFELKAMGFLIDNFLQVGIIAIIIVFQPELRRILEKVGRTRVSTFAQSFDKAYGGQTARENAIEGIVNACAELHNTKTGALIVIERNTKLGDRIETGCIINANCETSLLCNLFFKNSPLHDGAVIIRENRIYAASCMLPNTQKDQYLAKSLGTRHRAAVGMSENSDAVVIVVSEETGTISVAIDGQLTRELNEGALTNILNTYMPGSGTDKKKKKKARSGS